MQHIYLNGITNELNDAMPRKELIKHCKAMTITRLKGVLTYAEVNEGM